MAGSTFGKRFRITTWGESHGAAVGVVADGCPAGLLLCEADIQAYLDRRKPGTSAYSTPRREADQVEILSGTFEGKTTGTPISLMVRNTNERSKDYDALKDVYRPGHADYCFDAKYGIRDHRGGGRSSGRETIGRVAGGAIAALVLKKLGIEILTYAVQIGPVQIDRSRFDADQIAKNPLCMPDAEAAARAASYLDACKKEKDSAGGIIECVITGVPAGIGEPVFDKLDARLAQAVFSIGAVKGFEIGDGFAAASAKGSGNNDAFCISPDDGTGRQNTVSGICQRIQKQSNHAGGILGGISDGSPILFRAAIKPTPSIGIPQKTVAKDGRETMIEIGGRHDPVIVPRAVVVVECMAAVTILDLLLEQKGARIEDL